MDKGLIWKAAIILLAIGLAAYALYPIQENLTLGLDLQGGVYLVYEIDETELEEDMDRGEAVTRALEIIRNRIDEFGVTEPEIQRTGGDRIIVSLPGEEEPERAKEIIGRTALLEFRVVNENLRQDLEMGFLPEGYEEAPYREDNQGTLIVEDSAELTGSHLSDARVQFTDEGPGVSLTFDDEGAELFGQLTAQNVGNRIAILLDGEVLSAPNVREPIWGGTAQITGQFTDTEARDLALMLRAGALPAPLNLIEERTIGPSLGEDSIRAGLLAALSALVAVFLFMPAYYLLSGLIANVTLLLCLLFLMAGLAVLGATLTLPGIAGIILTIGMAVDANVIVFERIKEELAEGKPIRSAVDGGFDHAFSAIMDAQVTTIITAVALYWFGTGPVQGFAITLTLGILASLFSALFIGRFLFGLCTLRRAVNSIHIGWREYSEGWRDYGDDD